MRPSFRLPSIRMLTACLVFSGLTLSTQAESELPLTYRSIAVQGQMSKEAYTKEDPIVNEAMLREIAALGYNDLCIHVEWGEQTERIRGIHEGLAETGLDEVIEELGLTITIWTREFIDWDPDEWGEFDAENDELFAAMEKRYESYFELWPEIDYLVVTNTETQVTPKGRATFQRIFDTVAGVARENGAGIIVRSFGSKKAWLEEKVMEIPEDAWVQHKYVNIDWQLSLPDNWLIAEPQQHRMIVEFDIGGEFFETDHILNPFTDDLAERWDYITDSGAEGISVRLNRFGGTAFDHPNAVSYWYLGLLSSGQAKTVDEVWNRYCTAMFGAELAEEMEAILRPTQFVSREAMTVRSGAYGNNRPTWLAENNNSHGRRFEDPFFLHGKTTYVDSPPAYRDQKDYYEDEMRRMLTGDPEIIQEEEEGFDRQLASINQSIDRLEQLEGRLDADAYRYIHWLLEETRWYLKVMQNAQLAHLKAFRLRSGADEAEAARLREEIEAHLDRLDELAIVEAEIEGSWRNRNYKESRGGYADGGKFATEFRLWLAEQGLMSPPSFERDGERVVVDSFEDLEAYQKALGWGERETRHWVNGLEDEHGSLDAWLEAMFQRAPWWENRGS